LGKGKEEIKEGEVVGEKRSKTKVKEPLNKTVSTENSVKKNRGEATGLKERSRAIVFRLGDAARRKSQ